MNIKKITYLVWLALAITQMGCQKEEEPFVVQATLLEQMQQIFNPQNFVETLSYDYTVDWNSSHEQNSKELETTFYEFPLTYNSPINPEVLNKQKGNGYYISYKLVATVSHDNTFKFYMAKFYQQIDNVTRNSSFNLSLNTDAGYVGYTHLFDNENEMVFAKRIEEDLIKNNPVLLKKEFSDNDMANRVIEECVEVTTYHYKDWYKVVDGVAIFTHTQYLGATTEEECDSYWLPDLDITGGGGEGIYQNNGLGGVYEDCTGNKCYYEIEDEPIIGVNCNSFSYSAPSGALFRAAKVDNFVNRFWGAYLNLEGAGFGFYESSWESIYFVMPLTVTNGQAANLSAIAVTNALEKMKSYVWTFPRETEFHYKQKFESLLTYEMGLVGGSWQNIPPPFPIRTGEEYKISLFGAKTNCD